MPNEPRAGASPGWSRSGEAHEAALTGQRLRVGVIGPSRRRQGTGRWIARFLHAAGADLVAVAAASPGSARVAAAELGVETGASVAAAHSVEDLLGRGLDAVAICSPAAHHAEHLRLAHEAQMHVLCEKPLIAPEPGGTARRARDLAARFRGAGLLLYPVTQWVCTLDAFHAVHVGSCLTSIRDFAMHLSPPAPGQSMVAEAVPHAASLLVALGSTGDVHAVEACWVDGGDALNFAFATTHRNGHAIAARLTLRAQLRQPRPAWYALDGRRLDRVVQLDPYRIAFRAPSGATREGADPMAALVEGFVAAVLNRATTRVDDIHAQARLLDALGTAARDARGISHDGSHSRLRA